MRRFSLMISFKREPQSTPGARCETCIECDSADYAGPMGYNPVWAVALVLVGAAVSFAANLVGGITQRRMESSRRWDQTRLDVFSSFSTPVVSILQSASQESARPHFSEVSAVYQKIVLLGSPANVDAAEAVRKTGSAFVLSLPVSDDGVSDGTGHGRGHLASVQRQFALSDESSALQGAAFAALSQWVEQARKDLGVAQLGTHVVGRPLA